MSQTLQVPDAANSEMIYIKLPVGPLQCNCQIIGDAKTREAIVVDPGDEVERILSLLGRYKLKVKAIVSTHAHIDHVSGLAKLHQYTGAPVMMHNDDLPLYNAMEMQAAFIGMAPPELTEVDHLLKEGDALQWGSFHASVIHTPGDTLFAGSIGRTDLWGGSLEQIMESLTQKLLALPDETLVHPGHGPTTTIGQERASNPFLVT